MTKQHSFRSHGREIESEYRSTMDKTESRMCPVPGPRGKMP